MKMFYTDLFPLPLPDGHRFPIAKYRLLRQRIVEAGLAESGFLLVPEPATDQQILRAHDPAYLERLVTGRLTSQETRAIGFPWSPDLVHRARRSAGGTVAACRAAVTEGVAVNLAGGTHHAFRDRGEGYCLLNDGAIAARAMQAEGRADRVIVIDCDVHQGNGTASIFARDPTVFTFSIHGANNFPAHKARSDLDVALADGCGDSDYLEALDAGLTQALSSVRAELAIYLCGADPYSGDRLGHLSLSFEGLAARDRLVLERCASAGLPVAVAMAGGYAVAVEDTVAIHLQTVREALRSWRQRRSARGGEAESGPHETVGSGAGPASDEAVLRTR